ncbi:MAG TPA: hypothetical protein VEQ42_03785, partial [Pyrinomonadaceae bacterium]|nr:hypothetical protein [Pyrinomonadaceae bacterium]
MKARLFRRVALCVLVALALDAPVVASAFDASRVVTALDASRAAPAVAQRRARPQPRGEICHDPKAPCRTSLTFEPHDLPFR